MELRFSNAQRNSPELPGSRSIKPALERGTPLGHQGPRARGSQQQSRANLAVSPQR